MKKKISSQWKSNPFFSAQFYLQQCTSVFIRLLMLANLFWAKLRSKTILRKVIDLQWGDNTEEFWTKWQVSTVGSSYWSEMMSPSFLTEDLTPSLLFRRKRGLTELCQNQSNKVIQLQTTKKSWQVSSHQFEDNPTGKITPSFLPQVENWNRKILPDHTLRR